MSTVKAKLNKDNTVEITAEKRKGIKAESDPRIERETQEKLPSQNFESEFEKQERTKPSEHDMPKKNQNSMKKDIPKPVPEKQATKDEADEETTLEVVHDDEQQ